MVRSSLAGPKLENCISPVSSYSLISSFCSNIPNTWADFSYWGSSLILLKFCLITSNVSSLPEVIGQAGIQINPECDEELIKAYEKMYYDNFFRELCVDRGLIRANNFSWEKCANQVIDFICSKSS